MKKLTGILLAFSLLTALLTSCGSASTTSQAPSEPPATSSSAPAESETASSTPAPAADGENRTIVIFGSMLEDMLGIDPEEFFNEIQLEDGVENITMEGRDVHITMDPVRHQQLLDGIKLAIDTSILDILQSEEITSIKNIEYNSDVTVFDLTVDRVAFDSGWDALATMVLTVSGAMYQMYDGATEVDITLNLIDEATGQVYDTSHYPG